ncbi:MAG: hypothetical protein RIR02_965 [Pseudomonadota bacterium]
MLCIALYKVICRYAQNAIKKLATLYASQKTALPLIKMKKTSS